MGKIRWLHISDLHFGYNRYLVQNIADCQPKRPPVPYLAASL